MKVRLTQEEAAAFFTALLCDTNYKGNLIPSYKNVTIEFELETGPWGEWKGGQLESWATNGVNVWLQNKQAKSSTFRPLRGLAGRLLDMHKQKNN